MAKEGRIALIRPGFCRRRQTEGWRGRGWRVHGDDQLRFHETRRRPPDRGGGRTQGGRPLCDSSKLALSGDWVKHSVAEQRRATRLDRLNAETGDGGSAAFSSLWLGGRRGRLDRSDQVRPFERLSTRRLEELRIRRPEAGLEGGRHPRWEGGTRGRKEKQKG